MTALAVGPSPVLAPFELTHVSVDGVEHRVPLSEAWAVRFDTGRPVRRFTARKGQRHLSGLWWSATVGAHVGFESWLERDELMRLDFDPAVTGIASQPFWLHWTDEDGARVSHVPDYFAGRAHGAPVVIDCRPVERRPPRDVAKFAATARACELVGWEYRLVGAGDPVVTANLRWLGGYRHPRYWLPGTVAALREVFAAVTPLLAGAEAVGDPISVLPVLFHLLWHQELSVDMTVPLHHHTLVRARFGER